MVPGYGRGRRKTALTRLKTATLAPIPTPKESTVTTTRPGLRNMVRNA